MSRQVAELTVAGLIDRELATMTPGRTWSGSPQRVGPSWPGHAVRSAIG
jgi:hypothetical protein